MNINQFCVIMTETATLSNVISWSVPFLLGLFSSFIIDLIRNRIKIKRNNKFIKMYLTQSILPLIPDLQKAYESVSERINNYSTGILRILVFERFNSKVLNGITPTEYYEIFREDYTTLNEIIATIEYISENLPIKIDQKYFDFINIHLREKNKIDDLEYEKNSPDCIQYRKMINRSIDLRIDELNNLEEKILKLTRYNKLDASKKK